jgi:hypothetical protein
MKLIGAAALMAVLLTNTPPLAAQWGNRSAQEKGDVLGRDLAITPISFFGHTAIYAEYASGDPLDRTSSDEIEMCAVRAITKHSTPLIS